MSDPLLEYRVMCSDELSWFQEYDHCSVLILNLIKNSIDCDTPEKTSDCLIKIVNRTNSI